MKKLSAFTQYVAPFAYGAPDPTIEQFVLEACIDFCSRTKLVQTIDAMDAIAGVAAYAVSAPPQQQLSQVMRVTFNEAPLNAVPVDQVYGGAAMRAGTDSVLPLTRGTPRSFYQVLPTENDFYLHPVPDVDALGAIGVRAAFEPTHSATQVDDSLFDSWLAEIRAGALSKLLMVAGQPFSNPALATAYAKEFEAGVGRASRIARLGVTPGGLSVKPRPFA